MDICTAGSLDKKFIQDLYQRAFPEAKRKPFSTIERKVTIGETEMLLIREEGKRIGFAITVLGDRLVLLDYFAIAENWRGMGYGSLALEYLQDIYKSDQLFLEIEKPDDQKPDNGTRLRRKDFYLRNGMLETGISIELFGVPMELLSSKPGLSFEQCDALYHEMLGPMYKSVMKRIE